MVCKRFTILIDQYLDLLSLTPCWSVMNTTARELNGWASWLCRVWCNLFPAAKLQRHQAKGQKWGRDLPSPTRRQLWALQQWANARVTSSSEKQMKFLLIKLKNQHPNSECCFAFQVWFLKHLLGSLDPSIMHLLLNVFPVAEKIREWHILVCLPSPPTWGTSVKIFTTLGSISSSSPDLKNSSSNSTQFFYDFGAGKSITFRRSGGRVQVWVQLQALLSSDHHSRRLPKAVGGPMAGMSPLDGQEQTKSVSESMSVAVGSYWLSEPRSRIKWGNLKISGLIYWLKVTIGLMLCKFGAVTTISFCVCEK